MVYSDSRDTNLQINLALGKPVQYALSEVALGLFRHNWHKLCDRKVPLD